jgi:hypothetical protein
VEQHGGGVRLVQRIQGRGVTTPVPRDPRRRPGGRGYAALDVGGSSRRLTASTIPLDRGRRPVTSDRMGVVKLPVPDARKRPRRAGFVCGAAAVLATLHPYGRRSDLRVTRTKGHSKGARRQIVLTVLCPHPIALATGAYVWCRRDYLECGHSLDCGVYIDERPVSRPCLVCRAASAAHPGYEPPLQFGRGRRRRCPATGKLRYGSRVDAERELAAARASGNPRRREVRAYECPHCGMWHLTSQLATRAATNSP